MGMDSNLYAAGKVTDEELAAAEQFVRGHDHGGFGWPDKETGDLLCRWDMDVIRYRTLGRFFSPTYRRGEWPAIYTAIRVMQAAFPSCTIHYGSDQDAPDFGGSPEVDAEMLERNWAAWLTP